MASMITEKTVQNIIGRRNKEIHKGDCGRIMIAAGSEGMAGARTYADRIKICKVLYWKSSLHAGGFRNADLNDRKQALRDGRPDESGE